MSSDSVSPDAARPDSPDPRSTVLPADDEPTRDLWTPEPGWAPPGRDEIDEGPWVGAATDVGLRHHVNQDSVRLVVVPGDDPALPAPKLVVVAISDGVSSAPDSEVAAAKAATTASGLVTSWFTSHQIDDDQLVAGFTQAFAAANSSVLRGAPGREVGSCTLIVALVEPDAVTVGNIGDSRAYWVGDDDACGLLSVDDSVAQVRIDLGMSREEAERSMHAHAITRWLGPNATDVQPRMIRHRPLSPGWVIVCSDGLWNYASEPGHIGGLVRLLAPGRSAAELCAALADWANAQGGLDNITVAAVRVPLDGRHGDPAPVPDAPTPSAEG